MPNVLVDIDDTIADLHSVMLAWVNARLSKPLTYADLTLTHREQRSGQYHELVQDMLADPSRHEVQPLPNALEGMQRLHRAGYSVHIVSARKENWHQPTLDWLAQHGFAEFVTAVHPRSSAVKGTDFKREVAGRIKPAAAFEDTHNVAVVLADICPVVYLIDHPWNRDDIPENVRRVPSFGAAAAQFLSG